MGVRAPGRPAVPVVGVGGQRFDHAVEAVREQGVQGAAPLGAVGEGVPDLADDRGVPFGEDAVREGARLVGEEDGRERGVGPCGHAPHRTARVRRL